ncbi:MAG: hypothetical protein HWN66_09850 [Candidatus Helarchaeota archaeon]|nr:hypothetical protein [Candidatus Helarchaeota archaeon]
MNNRSINLEKQTRAKVEKLSMEIAERDHKIQQLTTELEQLTAILPSVSTVSTSADMVVLIKEHQNKIDKIEGERLQYLQVIKRLKDEKQKLKEGDYSEIEKELDEVRKTAQQLQKEKKNLGNKVSKLQRQIEHLNVQLTYVETYKTKSEVLVEDKKELLQQIKTLEGRIKTQTVAQEDLKRALQETEEKLKRTLQDLDEIRQKNWKINLELEQVKTELSKSRDLNESQADKIKLLKLQLIAAGEIETSASNSTGTSIPIQKKYFDFVKNLFVNVSRKPDGIILELEPLKRRWILTIGSQISVVEKNKALRVARSIPGTGLRIPNGTIVGKGYELIVTGE